jgi:hypothetical protein
MSITGVIPFVEGEPREKFSVVEESKDEDAAPIFEINYEEYVKNKMRDLLETKLIELAKRELELNSDLKT